MRSGNSATMSQPTPDDLRASLDKLSVVIEYFKRDLDETRRQVREEFVTMREYKQLQTAHEELRRVCSGNIADVRLSCESQIAEIRKTAAETIKALSDKIVTKEEFTPVKSIVFGVVALMLTTVVGALLVLVVRRG